MLAPLAGGPSTPELAAAVTDAGGLGFLAGGYLTADQLADGLRTTRALTSGALGVNLFCLRPVPVDDAAVAAYAAKLEPEARRRGVTLGAPVFDDDEWAEKLDVVCAAGVDVVSTTFGCPCTEVVDRLRASGAHVWVTVELARRGARRAGGRSRRARPPGHRGRRPPRGLDRRR